MYISYDYVRNKLPRTRNRSVSTCQRRQHGVSVGSNPYGIVWLAEPRSYNVRTKDGAIYRRTSRHLKKPRHDAGEVSRTSAPEALRCEIPREPQLPVIWRPEIPTVLPPNQPAEVPVADVPVVPSEVNNLPLRSRYGRIYKPPIRYEAWTL